MLAASVCHFYSGMPLHKRMSALASVAQWVANALVLRDPFVVICSDLGVVRVVSSVADPSAFLSALEHVGLVGVYDGQLALDVSGEACAAVMDDVVEILELRGL